MRTREEVQNIVLSVVIGVFVGFWALLTLQLAAVQEQSLLFRGATVGSVALLVGLLPWGVRNAERAVTRLVLRAMLVSVLLLAGGLGWLFGELTTAAMLVGLVAITLVGGYVFTVSTRPDHSLLVFVWNLAGVFCLCWAVLAIELVVETGDMRIGTVLVLILISAYGIHDALIEERKAAFS